MRYRMFQRRDQRGMLVLVPMLQALPHEAQAKHGPLEAVGAIDAGRETSIDWNSVRCELNLYGYATLPRHALPGSDAARPQRTQSS